MNAKTPDTGGTPLHLAILGGREAAAKALIMAGADANIFDAYNDAPLHLAIERGHVGIAQDLLISGADHALRCSTGEYPIHLAASRGQNGIALALVQKGANLDSLDGETVTPLVVAVRKDHVSTVEVLLAGGADANFEMGPFRETVLHDVAERNRAAFIPALIEAGADIEARNTRGWTPLCFAARKGSCAAMLALLHLGANVDTKSKGQWTPLHYVCRNGKPDAADLLLRWGADETIVDQFGKIRSQWIPNIALASEQDRPTFERLTKLLAHAPQDRAWRRRGLVVMCRAHPDRLRLVVEIPDNAARAIGQQPRERPSRRARRGQVKVEVQMGGAHGAGGGGSAGSSSNVCARRRAGGEGAGGGFDGVAAWLMAVTEEDVFRKIVGFL